MLSYACSVSSNFFPATIVTLALCKRSELILILRVIDLTALIPYLASFKPLFTQTFALIITPEYQPV